MGNIFGHLFRVVTFGESHGAGLGCVVDGCPPRVSLSTECVQQFLDRRRPGQSEFTTPRAETDHCEIISGTENNMTLGSPICILIRNQDAQKSHYNDIGQVYRPGHADYTTLAKYGIASASGGGRASARETAGRVAAAAVAKAFLTTKVPGLKVHAYVSRVSDIYASPEEEQITEHGIESSILRCPDPRAEALMQEKIRAAKDNGDSLGGEIKCLIQNVPVGLGEPVFDKLHANLAKAMLSIPAAKYFSFGDGFQSTFLQGSENNDPYSLNTQGHVVTAQNRDGGVQGGISNGMPIVFHVGFKPVSTIFKEQSTLTKQEHQPIQFTPTQGRHDPCVLPRAVVIAEAMSWLVLADHFLLAYAGL